VASLNLVGRWFGRRLPKAMATYSIIVSIGFMAAFPIVGSIVSTSGWRIAWSGIGGLLIVALMPLVWLTVRRNPEACGLPADGDLTAKPSTTSGLRGATFKAALATPAFWVFAIASSTYNLVISGIGLFIESILLERGFPANIYHQALAVTAITSLAGNFLGGWLSARWTANRLMALTMGLLMIALLALPFLRTVPQVMLWAVFMGVAGGFVIVIFFSFWSRTFGRAHLGKIQGAAQMMTVLASAVGPLMLAQCVRLTGSYTPVFLLLAAVVALLAVAAWFVRVPGNWSESGNN
jgi:cyanate permease